MISYHYKCTYDIFHDNIIFDIKWMVNKFIHKYLWNIYSVPSIIIGTEYI